MSSLDDDEEEEDDDKEEEGERNMVLVCLDIQG